MAEDKYKVNLPSGGKLGAGNGGSFKFLKSEIIDNKQSQPKAKAVVKKVKEAREVEYRRPGLRKRALDQETKEATQSLDYRRRKRGFY